MLEIVGQLLGEFDRRSVVKRIWCAITAADLAARQETRATAPNRSHDSTGIA